MELLAKQLASTVRQGMRSIRITKKQLLIWVPLLGLASAIFVWGARQQSVLVNIDMSSTDQSAYMEDARKIANMRFQFVGGRNRMPLYPTLMSFFYTDGMSNDTFFAIGKNIGVGIGLLCLAVFYFLISQVAQPFDSVTATLVAAFTVFAYKAPYFQTEILFYTINLILFYLLLRFVKVPSTKLAILSGLIGGIGYLTKASVLPAIALAVCLVFVQAMFDFWMQWRNEADRPMLVLILKKFVYIIVLLGCFLLVVFPYIRTSKERFGTYFYNVNSTFYIWYDSWPEAVQGTKAHGDRVGWPDMPPEEIPSLQKYLNEHTTPQVVGRFTNGYKTLFSKNMTSYGYAEFLFIYLVISVALLIQNKTLQSAIHPWPLLFVCGYFIGYSLLYAWYMPIASGNRFVLSLFLPLLYLFGWFLSVAQSYKANLTLFGRQISASSFSPLILMYLIGYLIVIFPFRIATMYAGS
ncbi:MAG: hypothetical protein ACI85U_001001 [Candidatus Promineifilaceae bacterium]